MIIDGRCSRLSRLVKMENIRDNPSMSVKVSKGLTNSSNQKWDHEPCPRSNELVEVQDSA